MTGVRNGPLARGATNASGATQLGTVPAGLTWLLKTVQVFNTTAAPIDLVLQFNAGAGGTLMQLPPIEALASQGVIWEGWMTLAAGDVVFALAPEGLYVWLHGAELPGEIPQQRAAQLPARRT